MAYDTESVKVTIGCRVNSTDEVAETGFYLSDPNTNVFDAVAYLAAGSSVAGSIATAFTTLRGASAFITPNWSTFSYVKMAAIDQNGHYLAEPVSVSVSSVGASTVGQPLQLTPVVSLSSGQSLGYANRGRMYLPHMYATLATSGYRYSNPALMLAQVQTFFGSVTTAASSVSGFTSTRVCIMSSKGTGAHKRAAFARIGDLPDVQRRRRNAVSEAYVQGAI